MVKTQIGRAEDEVPELMQGIFYVTAAIQRHWTLISLTYIVLSIVGISHVSNVSTMVGSRLDPHKASSILSTLPRTTLTLCQLGPRKLATFLRFALHSALLTNVHLLYAFLTPPSIRYSHTTPLQFVPPSLFVPRPVSRTLPPTPACIKAAPLTHRLGATIGSLQAAPPPKNNLCAGAIDNRVCTSIHSRKSILQSGSESKHRLRFLPSLRLFSRQADRQGTLFRLSNPIQTPPPAATTSKHPHTSALLRSPSPESNQLRQSVPFVTGSLPI